MSATKLSDRLEERAGTTRIDNHSYVILGISDDTWLDVVADAYRELRTSTPFPIQDLTVDGIEIVNATEVLRRLEQTQVPARRAPGSQRHLAVERADLGEVLMAVLGDERHGYLYGYRSTRDRELVSLPGRSIDQIGVLETSSKIVLSLGEAKVTWSTSTPPAVVDSKSDSLRNQHLGHLRSVSETAQKIYAAARKSTDQETQRLLLIAAALFEQKRFDVLVVRCTSMLVRPDGSSVDDFGTHRSDPSDYAPGEVDFVIMHVPGDIEDVVTKFVAKARREQLDEVSLREVGGD